MTMFVLVGMVWFGSEALAAGYFLMRKQPYTMTKGGALATFIVRGVFAAWAAFLLFGSS